MKVHRVGASRDARSRDEYFAEQYDKYWRALSPVALPLAHINDLIAFLLNSMPNTKSRIADR